MTKETFVTNFYSHDTRYQEAAKDLNEVWIEEEAYDVKGNLRPDMNSLHTSNQEQLLEFWKRYHELPEPRKRKYS